MKKQIESMLNSKYLMLELTGIISFFTFWDEIWMEWKELVTNSRSDIFASLNRTTTVLVYMRSPCNYTQA